MTGKIAFLRITVCILLLTAVSSCKKDVALEEINPVPHAVKLEVPGNFPGVEQDLDNPLTAEGIELGRMLFYDVRLSGNNRISCASLSPSGSCFYRWASFEYDWCFWKNARQACSCII